MSYVEMLHMQHDLPVVKIQHNHKIDPDDKHKECYQPSLGKTWNFSGNKVNSRERERLSLSAFLRTEDIGVHIVHISRLIITYTLE